MLQRGFFGYEFNNGGSEAASVNRLPFIGRPVFLEADDRASALGELLPSLDALWQCAGFPGAPERMAAALARPHS